MLPIMLLSSLFFALLSASVSTQSVLTPEVPSPPALEYLYTAHVHCLNNLLPPTLQGPRGIRKAIPIVGGNFSGPHLNGEILNLGADWGLTDPRTGLFSADTRYQLKTHDGADLFLQTSGPRVPAGGLHLRVVIETGDERYYWLNNIVAVGVLRNEGEDENGEGFVLRIDVWHMAGEYTNTTFIDSS